MAKRSSARGIFSLQFLLVLWTQVLLAAAEAESRTGASRAAPMEFVIESWQTRHGLPQSSVRALAQGPDGFLWLDVTEGLARFDGVQFKRFPLEDAPEFHVNTSEIFTDRYGRMWLAITDGGLACWQAGQWKRCLSAASTSSFFSPVVGTADGGAYLFTGSGRLLRYFEGLATELREAAQFGRPRRATVREDNRGAIWFVTDQDRLVRFVDGRFAEVDCDGLRVTGMGSTAPGEELWIVTEKGLARPRDGGFEHLPAPANSRWHEVTSVRVGKNGTMWAIQNENLWVHQQNQWGRVLTNWPPFGGRLRVAMVDDRGRLWCGTDTEGLVCVRGDGTVRFLTTRNGLRSNRVEALEEDHEGSIWVGLELGGLARVTSRRFEAVGLEQGMSDRLVRAVGEDAAGRVWLGTELRGVNRWDGTGCTHFALGPAGQTDPVRSLCVDGQGKLWAGSYNHGLFHFEGERFVPVQDVPEFRDQVLAIHADRSGRLWIGNVRGIYSWHQGRVRKHEARDGRPTVGVRALAEDGAGRIWIGTRQVGMGYLEGDQFVMLRKEDGLPSESICVLRADPEGAMWFGTSDAGFGRWRGGYLRVYDRRYGLPDDHIAQIELDSAGFLWLGSQAGVIRVSRVALNALDAGVTNWIASTLFGTEDGLPARECTMWQQPGSLRAKDGRMWFATINGAASCRPEEVELNLLPPAVVVDEILADGTPLQHGGPLKIGPGQPRVEIHYAALSFAAPAKVRYRYHLEGLEPDWIDAGGTRTVSYNHLPPGDYRFRVTACNNDGIWSESGAAVAFTVVPYFWQTSWFLVTAILGGASLVGGTVWLVDKGRTRRKLERLEQERALEHERARIAQDLHDDLGTRVTEIGLLSAMGSRTGVSPEQARRHLETISNQAESMVGAMDEIVWALNPKNYSVSSLVNYFCLYAQNFLRIASIRCLLDVAKDLPEHRLDSEQRHQLFLAFKEALNNVVRHARATQVLLGIMIRGDALVVFVEDNGIGMPAEMPNAGADGLINMRARLERLGGKCEIASAASARGTRVSFELPLRRVAARTGN